MWQKFKRLFESGEHSKFIWESLAWLGYDQPIKAAVLCFSSFLSGILAMIGQLPAYMIGVIVALVFALTGIGANAWEDRHAKREQKKAKGPLEIIFDPTNPVQKFWSIEPMRDADGRQIAGSFWEYRAVIKNQSARTVKNVKVLVQAKGIMPTRPEHSRFDINKGHLIDLTPNEETLVVIRTWFNPRIVAGMAFGEGVYGPIEMTAMGDDVLPTTRIFQFDPMQTPMIFEPKPDVKSSIP